MGILGLAILGVMGLISKDFFIGKSTPVIPAETAPADREFHASGEIPDPVEDFQSEIYVFSPDSFKREPTVGETDSITAQLNAEGIAHFT
ncbi:MAG TPA: hypothetical protein VLB09_06135, partial [Nitrospiria bacterium]|nr:hypothetical protein [Nitrospiria bacterium]